MVCLSVGLSHYSDPCKNDSTDRDAVWVEDSEWVHEPYVLDGSRSPIGMGNFEERRIFKVIHLLQAFENTINCLQTCAVAQFNSVDCILIVSIIIISFNSGH